MRGRSSVSALFIAVFAQPRWTKHAIGRVIPGVRLGLIVAYGMPYNSGDFVVSLLTNPDFPPACGFSNCAWRRGKRDTSPRGEKRMAVFRRRDKGAMYLLEHDAKYRTGGMRGDPARLVSVMQWLVQREDEDLPAGEMDHGPRRVRVAGLENLILHGSQ
jgi:hypothetical protein